MFSDPNFIAQASFPLTSLRQGIVRNLCSIIFSYLILRENYFTQVVLRETDQISGIKDYFRNIWDRLQTWLLTLKNKFKRIDYPHPPMKLQIDLLISRGLEVN